MPRTGEEILADINATLDQLLYYADVVKSVALERFEREALHKTQESLLARLIHMETLLRGEPKQPKALDYKNIQKKIDRYSRLNTKLINEVAHRCITDFEPPHRPSSTPSTPGAGA